MKKCTGCGETKPLTEFHKRTRNLSTGCHPRCKVCRNKLAKEHILHKLATDPKWREQFYAKMSAQKVRRYREDPAFRAKVKTKNRLRYHHLKEKKDD